MIFQFTKGDRSIRDSESRCNRQIHFKAFEKCPESDSRKTKPTERDKKQRSDGP